jgi:hypothetical protein
MSGDTVRTVGNARRPDYTSLTFLRGGAWLAVAGSKGLEVFDAASGGCVVANSRFVYCGLHLACRGSLILAGGSLSILELQIPPAAGGAERRAFWQVDGVHHHEIAADGNWAVGFREDANPVVIDLTARLIAHTLSHPARVSLPDAVTGRGLPSVRFSTQAPRIALADGVAITAFDLMAAEDFAPVGAIPAPYRVGRPAFTLPPPDEWPPNQLWRPPFALTPDGRGLLVKRPRERVQLWDVDAGTLAAEWNWRLDGITCLAVAPDGLTAVAGARFGRLLTWDLD